MFKLNRKYQFTNSPPSQSARTLCVIAPKLESGNRKLIDSRNWKTKYWKAENWNLKSRNLKV
ncbi:hypothetical protein, partial [Flavobacterium salmonis]|uniref:hypothetical protein n=1 Tax=Flavobacterium salmonis TaxID=2654844 RepID=UPI0036164005